MDTDSKDDRKTRKVKKQVRKGDLPIASGTSSLDASTKTALTEKESSMVMEDKLVADTEEKKNELEAFIYDLRAKLDEQYAEHGSEEEKTEIRAKLESTEVRYGHFLTLKFCVNASTDVGYRTGFTMKAMMLQRASTSQRLRRSVLLLCLSSTDTRRKSRLSAVPSRSESRLSRLPKEPLRKRLARLLRPRRQPRADPTRR